MPSSVFDPLAADYDAARPSYPAGIFDALEAAAGPLAGQLTVDCGAGTGIATRQLAARGARTVALDIGEQMLRRALARSPGQCCLLADGNALPIRSGRADLVTFGQSWHWFKQDTAAGEVARILRPGGHWAAWWNHPATEGQPWFEAYQDLMESACGQNYRHQRQPEASWAGEAIAATGAFGTGIRTVVEWTRRLSTAGWIAEDRSKSYVGLLPPAERDRLLAAVTRLLDRRFPDGQMAVPYRTAMWLAQRKTTQRS
jgi:ubiquinone/menaquinone biosynthesis C-methylase UbiE